MHTKNLARIILIIEAIFCLARLFLKNDLKRFFGNFSSVILPPKLPNRFCFFVAFPWPSFSPEKSASPKPHPSKPHPCNMPQAKTEVALQFSECCAAEVALQHSLFCSPDVILTKSCAAASELDCNIAKAALQKSGAFLPLSCGFQAPRLGTHVWDLLKKGSWLFRGFCVALILRVLALENSSDLWPMHFCTLPPFLSFGRVLRLPLCTKTRAHA